MKFNLLSSKDFQPTKRLTTAESRFVLFMSTVQHPIDNQKIVEWYRKYVMSPNSFWARQERLDFAGHTNDTWKSGTATRILNEYALQWFDRNLGKAIRNGLSFNKEDYKTIQTGNDDRYFLLEQVNA